MCSTSVLDNGYSHFSKCSNTATHSDLFTEGITALIYWHKTYVDLAFTWVGLLPAIKRTYGFLVGGNYVYLRQVHIIQNQYVGVLSGEAWVRESFM